MYFTTVCMCSRRSLTARLISIGQNREGVCMIMYFILHIRTYIHMYVPPNVGEKKFKKSKKRKKEKKKEIYLLSSFCRVILESGFAYFFCFSYLSLGGGVFLSSCSP